MTVARDPTVDFHRFEVVRREDSTGVSGTGVVAVGVEFPSGAVVFEWLNHENPHIDTAQNGISVKPGPDGLEDTIEVHGHGGRTNIRYVDAKEHDTERRDTTDD